ncbi:MAG: flagellar basal body rod protein FlgB [Alphaproteobacteria bacterium CG11_big_fil_rev_8_21_14_0_20_39_49]|nr:MAG: flagellar basal body rod protein FlgB [Alphaproteobacteria bacterium CG11_big_fil_rev_8_21_14_0_20_39_49]
MKKDNAVVMKKFALATLMLSFLPSASYSQQDILSSLSNKLKYLNQRQSVISHNIANADTPGFKARDLEEFRINSASGSNMGIKLQATAPGHIGGATSVAHFKTIKQDDSYDTSLDGNNVSLEEQMIKMAETDMEYNKVVGIMRQYNGLVRSAIGGNR